MTSILSGAHHNTTRSTAATAFPKINPREEDQRQTQLWVYSYMSVSACAHMCDSREQLDKGMEINYKWQTSSRLPTERVKQGWIGRGRRRNKGRSGRIDGFVVFIHLAS